MEIVGTYDVLRRQSTRPIYLVRLWPWTQTTGAVYLPGIEPVPP